MKWKFTQSEEQKLEQTFSIEDVKTGDTILWCSARESYFGGRETEARLIAAAPELLDALRALTDHWQRADKVDLRRSEDKALLGQALAALAKAEARK